MSQRLLCRRHFPKRQTPTGLGDEVPILALVALEIDFRFGALLIIKGRDKGVRSLNHIFYGFVVKRPRDAAGQQKQRRNTENGSRFHR
jgi:hypothetical protein